MHKIMSSKDNQLLCHVSFSSTVACCLKTALAAILLNAVLALLNESTLRCSVYLALLGSTCPSAAAENPILCVSNSTMPSMFILPLPLSPAQSKMPTSMSLYLAVLASTCPSAASEKPHLNICLQFYIAVTVHSAFSVVSCPIQDAYFDVSLFDSTWLYLAPHVQTLLPRSPI
jgi:hypothetical protein